MTGRTHQCIGESVTGIFDVSDELFLSEISRPMLPETLERRGGQAAYSMYDIPCCTHRIGGKILVR